MTYNIYYCTSTIIQSVHCTVCFSIVKILNSKIYKRSLRILRKITMVLIIREVFLKRKRTAQLLLETQIKTDRSYDE